jgi:membrane dipeptidase
MELEAAARVSDRGRHDFGLSDAEEVRAEALHRGCPIVDLLYWGPTGPLTFPPDVEARLREAWDLHGDPMRTYAEAACWLVERQADGLGDDYRDNWEASGVTAGTRSVELGSPEIALRWFSWVQAAFDRLPWLSKALCADDIRAAKREGRQAAIINTQLITGPGPDLLGSLPLYHGLGLRILQLTYNSMNALGAGCTERTDAGLSGYGQAVVAEMNSLGMIVDLSHCGRQTTLDACAHSRRPVMITHATAEGVYPHARAKSDDELRAAAATGGVIGVNVLPAFLSAEGPATIDQALDHIDYIAGLVGWDHVAIGTDHPMPMPPSINRAVGEAAVGGTFRTEDGIDFERITVGFEDYRDFPNFTRGLVHRGYDDHQIAGILGENALRVIEAVCG